MVRNRKPDIRLLDMSVLLVFQELMLRRKAASVAEKLNLTQSAISYSLNRLRQFFDDQLFVRTPTGMTPTPVAFELAPRIDAILEQTRGLSVRGSDDDPATWTGTPTLVSRTGGASRSSIRASGCR